MAIHFLQLRATAARWIEVNYVLHAGEFGIEIDTDRFKIGDGTTPWTGLQYYVQPDDSMMRSRYASVNFASTSYSLMNPGSGDHTSMIQNALNEAANTGSYLNEIMTDVVLGKQTYNASGLVMPAGVHLRGDGAVLANNRSGWMITMPNIRSKISQICLQGGTPPSGGATGAAQGIQISAHSCQLDRVIFETFAGAAVSLTSSSGQCQLSNLFAENCWQDITAVAAPVGVLDIAGNDHWINQGEFTASRTSLSTGGYIYAIKVGGANHFLNGLLGELSDHGYYIGATYLRMVNCRSDLNRGHGFVIATASGSMVGCTAMSNGTETANTYDGYNFQGSSNMRLSACYANAPSGSHRWGFNDAGNSATQYNTFDATCDAQPSARNAVTGTINVQPFAGGRVNATDGPFLAITAASTSWSVQKNGWPHKNWVLSSVSPVNFTDFTNEVTGMDITVIGDGQTTFVHNASFIRMRTGADTLAVANRVYRFVNRNGVWYEVGTA